MKTKTLKLSFITFLAPFMCFSILLSTIHAKDTISMIGSPKAESKLLTKDIAAKALSELHSHTDKTSMKNIHVNASTTAVRVRRLNVLDTYEDIPTTITTVFHDFLLRFRVVTSLCFQYA